MNAPCCRSCRAPLTRTMVDLGMSPVSNAFVPPEKASEPEVFYPLKALVCERCWLVQLQDYGTRETHFHADYAYFSSFSQSWLRHAEDYVETMCRRLRLDTSSRVVEVASNDGYLLRHFVRHGIPSLGIDPAANCARAAWETYGVRTEVAFFGEETARRVRAEFGPADLIIANNVLAHVPDLRDFVGGFRELLAPDGTATFEFPHLLNLLAGDQFDTIYHEHYSYLSVIALSPLFERHGLRIVDVERLATHGGSLRLTVRAAGAGAASDAVRAVEAEERAAGLDRAGTYAAFGESVAARKRALLSLLLGLRNAGKVIAGYGAPAKGNTLLNYCGIREDILRFTVDRNPNKQGMLLPGTRIPVRALEDLLALRPDYVLILPWNLEAEIVEQMAEIRSWGGRFIRPLPAPAILP